MSPVSLRLTQANIPHCSHIGPLLGPDPASWGLSHARSGTVVPRKNSGIPSEDSDGLLYAEGVLDADPSGPWSLTKAASSGKSGKASLTTQSRHTVKQFQER